MAWNSDPGIATLLLSEDRDRREWAAKQWRSQFPIAYEHALPIARTGSATHAAVNDVVAAMQRAVNTPTGIICSLAGSSADAQSSLLLALENAMPQWRVLLLGVHEHDVLATVRSRCHVYTLPGWSEEELTAYADEHGIASEYVATAMGSRSRLRSLGALAAVSHTDPLTRRITLAKESDRATLLDVLTYEQPPHLGEQLDLLQRGARPEWVIAGWGRKQ
jgi:hypothetical protein